jgi:hypothetical protein
MGILQGDEVMIPHRKCTTERGAVTQSLIYARRLLSSHGIGDFRLIETDCKGASMDLRPWRFRVALIALLTGLGCMMTTALLFALFTLSQSFIFWVMCFVGLAVWSTFAGGISSYLARLREVMPARVGALRVPVRRLP